MHSSIVSELQFEDIYGEEVGRGNADEIQVLTKGNLLEQENKTGHFIIHEQQWEVSME